ncbi:hypothetical protein [Actinoplanes siamensis]|uniref:hypothetical protein n=1 Tax=Actinoplanes siamensis TaxID=1223317 RepID=UPI001943A610|nr:hypothetical protein [Actinoplanes siamensis]
MRLSRTSRPARGGLPASTVLSIPDPVRAAAVPRTQAGRDRWAGVRDGRLGRAGATGDRSARRDIYDWTVDAPHA